ncbi:MAG: hypothetical protein KDD70_16880 [Bdellovibrionales bacterium]|nr:hypothetical protein [Bdellovibrionales bacterium]
MNEELIVTGFYKRSYCAVATLQGVVVESSHPLTCTYREGDLSVELRKHLDHDYTIREKLYVDVPEDLKWDNSEIKIDARKRQSIIKNLLQGLYLMGYDVNILQGPHMSLLEAELTEQELFRVVATEEEVDKKIEVRKQYLLDHKIPKDKAVIASGVNREAYVRPGDPEAMLNKGLIPYEATDMGRALLQFFKEAEVPPAARDSLWFAETRRIGGMEGNLTWYPSTKSGLGDVGLLVSLYFDFGLHISQVTSINNIPMMDVFKLWESKGHPRPCPAPDYEPDLEACLDFLRCLNGHKDAEAA